MKLIFQHDGVWRWSLWRVNRFRWDYKEGRTMMALVFLQEKWEIKILSAMWGHTWPTTSQKGALTSEWSQAGLSRIIPLSRISQLPKSERNSVFKPLVYGILLYQPVCNQTPGKCVSVLKIVLKFMMHISSKFS